MPLYDYDCASCGTRFEVIHGVHAEGPTSCPSCGGGPVRKAFTAPAIHFKGSGWAKKERRSTATSGSGAKAGDAAAPADGASDAGSSTEKADVPAPSAPTTAASTTD